MALLLPLKIYQVFHSLNYKSCLLTIGMNTFAIIMCVSVIDVPNDTGESVLTHNNDKGEQRVAKLREYMRQKRLVEPGECNNFRKTQRQNESLKDKYNASMVYLVLTASIQKFCMFVIPCSK